MKFNAKILALTAVLAASMLAGCGDSNGGQDDAPVGEISVGTGTNIATQMPQGDNLPAISVDGNNAETLATDGEYTDIMSAIAGDNTETKPPMTTLSQLQASKYAYSSLSDSEKQLYTEMVNSVNNFDFKSVFSAEYDRDTLNKVFTLVYQNEPSLFQMDSVFSEPGETNRRLKIKYRCTPEEFPTMRAAMDAEVDKIVSTIPSGSSTAQQLIAIHDYLVLNVKYGDEQSLCKSAYGPLVMHMGNCDGYSKAAAYIFDKIGIENVLVLGKNGSGADAISHAWNLVKVDGEWYIFDVTWDDPMNMTDPTYLRHNYLLVNDSETLGVTHFMTMPYYQPPTATGTKHNYFSEAGLMASSASDGETLIKKAVLEAAKTKQTQIQVRFSSKAAFDEAYEKLITGKGLTALLEETNKTSPAKVDTSSYKSYNDKNLYIIHFGVTYK